MMTNPISGPEGLNVTSLMESQDLSTGPSLRRSWDLGMHDELLFAITQRGRAMACHVFSQGERPSTLLNEGDGSSTCSEACVQNFRAFSVFLSVLPVLCCSPSRG